MHGVVPANVIVCPYKLSGAGVTVHRKVNLQADRILYSARKTHVRSFHWL
jgi:hypothetical protein